MHPLIAVISLMLLLAQPTLGGERGSLRGGIVHEMPGYFKESFLDIAEDAAEAASGGRQLILFFHLNECPYCERMLRETFATEPYKGRIQAGFDVIAVNARGDKEISFDAQTAVTEKELSALLQVESTPAILFLDENNKLQTRVDGYRSPAEFSRILDYVAGRHYQQQALVDYLAAHKERGYRLQENPLFERTTDLAALTKPVLLLFEDTGCTDCTEFHQTVLPDPRVQTALQAFSLVRLDADSEAEIIAPDGHKTTPKALAQQHQMSYRPGALLFAQKKLVARSDSLLYPFHFSLRLDWVSSGAYHNQSLQDFSNARIEELLSQGQDIDMGAAPR